MVKKGKGKVASKKTGTKAKAATKARLAPRPARAPAKKVSAKARATAAPGPFSRESYDLPHLEGAEAVTLAKALYARRLSKPAAVAEEAFRMGRALEAAKRAGTDAKAYDAAMDRSWATFVRRIQDHAELPVDRHPDAVVARQVYAIVRDLSILDLGFLAEFAQIGARLDALRREGLIDMAQVFAGKLFLDEVLHCHARYGEALGLGGDHRTEAAKTGEARHALVSAVEEYVVQALALARTDSESVAKALAPILELKERQHARLVGRPERKAPAHPPIGQG